MRHLPGYIRLVEERVFGRSGPLQGQCVRSSMAKLWTPGAGDYSQCAVSAWHGEGRKRSQGIEPKRTAPNPPIGTLRAVRTVDPLHGGWAAGSLEYSAPSCRFDRSWREWAESRFNPRPRTGAATKHIATILRHLLVPCQGIRRRPLTAEPTELGDEPNAVSQTPTKLGA